MQELRFDGRTAIVTGSGGNPSLGRAHAMLLAARGANVVINDIGGGTAPGPAKAQSVVDEIVALGGKAVADDNTVATPEGAEAIVKTALEAYGQVDIVVNNAGVIFQAAIDELPAKDHDKMIDVNLMGPIYLSRAIWPHMAKRGYGRIVNITSGSMFGAALQVSYGASKGGLWAFTRAIAAEGERVGIKANAVSPGAFTRMLIGAQEEDCSAYQFSKANLPPQLVSPAVAFLAHEDCPVSGECFDVMGGAMRRVYMGRSDGIVDPELTIEKVASNWDAIMGPVSDQLVPVGVLDGFKLHNKPYSERKSYDPVLS